MARRVVLFVLSAVGALVGLGLLIGGIVLAALFGPDSTASTTGRELRTPTAALITPSSQISTGGLQVGTVRIDLSVEQGAKPAFIGIAPAADFDRYAGSAPVDELTNVRITNDAFAYDTTRRGGGAPSALPAPDSQGFWVARATGTGAQTIRWNALDGSYVLVVMNADGSPGVDQRVGAGLHIGFMWPLALTLIIVGAVLVLLAVLFLVLGVRARPRQPGYGSGYGSGPGHGPGTGYGSTPGYGPMPGYGSGNGSAPGVPTGPEPGSTAYPGPAGPPPPPRP